MRRKTHSARYCAWGLIVSLLFVSPPGNLVWSGSPDRSPVELSEQTLAEPHGRRVEYRLSRLPKVPGTGTAMKLIASEPIAIRLPRVEREDGRDTDSGLDVKAATQDRHDASAQYKIVKLLEIPYDDRPRLDRLARAGGKGGLGESESTSMPGSDESDLVAGLTEEIETPPFIEAGGKEVADNLLPEPLDSSSDANVDAEGRGVEDYSVEDVDVEDVDGADVGLEDDADDQDVTLETDEELESATEEDSEEWVDADSESSDNEEYLSDDGSFPALPPDPNDEDKETLPDLDLELWSHGGSYLYNPEGDRLGLPSKEESHYDYLRLPEDWCAPEPVTAFTGFQAASGVRRSRLGWLGPGEYTWEPRFVGYGSYQLFGFAFEQAGHRSDAIGHQLLIDLDLRLTGTERFHVQFRPVGERNTGGSFYEFSDSQFVDNSTATPDRYWFEGDIHSILGWGNDVHASRYLNFLAGKFPFQLHKSLLLNDDILGVVLSRNNLRFRNASNVNLQLFAGFHDVDTFPHIDTNIYGVHASVDYKRQFYEATYAFANSAFDREAHYAGFSGTRFFGPRTIAARALFKFGDESGTGSGQLFTLETNRTRVFEHEPFGIHHGVFFCNAFWASEGWNSMGGGNLNRLRTAFEVNPLVRLAAGPAQQDTYGVALGVQLFRHHEDESLIPEFAWESPGGESVYGVGLRYLKKTSARSSLEIFSVKNWSDAISFKREGVFVSHSWIF